MSTTTLRYAELMSQIKKIIVRAVTNLFRLLGIDIFRFYARAYPKWKYEFF